MNLDEAKLRLRVDLDDDDDRIRALIAAGEAYIEVATGLPAAQQTAEPLCTAAMDFLLIHWYGGEIDFYSERALASLLKTIKAKHSAGQD